MEKQITIKRMTLTNFKKFTNKVIDFKSRRTDIYGRNQTGKTTIMNAYLWCLYGKDKFDRKDYEIKRLVDGKSLPKVDASVEVVLDINGEEVTIKRTYCEDWVKPRGEETEVFKGHHTEYEFNGVPMNMAEFNSMVEQTVPSDRMKVLSNPLYFPTMHWQKQRDILFEMVGCIDESVILEQNEEYKDLLQKLGGKSLEHYNAEASAKKKKIKEQLKDIAPRIDQTEKLKPEALDYEYLEKDLADVDARLEVVNNKIKGIKEEAQSLYDMEKGVRDEITSLRIKQEDIAWQLKKAEVDRVDAANAHIIRLKQDLNEKTALLSSKKKIAESILVSIEAAKESLKVYENTKGDLVKEWQILNASSFDTTNDTCKSCGQQLPEVDRERLREIFNENKKVSLGKITDSGNSVNAQIEMLKSVITEREGEQTHVISEIDLLWSAIRTIEERISTIPEEKPSEIDFSQNEEYQKLSEEISKLEDELKGKTTAPDYSKEDEIRKELTAKRDEILKNLNTKNDIERLDKAINDLREEGKRLSQTLAEIEKAEEVLSKYNEAKISLYEEKINSLFERVKFRLFDKTIEGGLVETCVPLVEGVPFGAANDGGRANAGLDIINAMSRHYGISVPIFIDNGEGVNDLAPTVGQTITLNVSFDNELTIR